MADTTISGAQLRGIFAKQAVMPQKPLDDAQAFITQLETNGTVKAADVQKGKGLLRNLNEGTANFEFYAAVLAGQESTTDAELETQLKRISDSIGQAETIAKRLKSLISGEAA